MEPSQTPKRLLDFKKSISFQSLSGSVYPPLATTPSHTRVHFQIIHAQKCCGAMPTEEPHSQNGSKLVKTTIKSLQSNSPRHPEIEISLMSFGCLLKHFESVWTFLPPNTFLLFQWLEDPHQLKSSDQTVHSSAESS